MAKKGSTLYEKVIVEEGKLAPVGLRSVKRAPVVVTGMFQPGLLTVQRKSTKVGDRDECATDTAELWTVDYVGDIQERIVLHCEFCGWRANLHSLRLWRLKHRKKSWVEKFYCCLECKAKAQRKKDKRDRPKLVREMADRDGSV